MIWLIGKNGMLGNEIENLLESHKIDFLSTGKEVDVTVPSEIDSFIKTASTENYLNSEKDKKIRWIINCSAYTNVDKAETEIDIAKKLNTYAPLYLARTARNYGAKLIHFSTDYVFGKTGGKPENGFSEEAEKNPAGIYATTKSEGENAIQKEMTQYYIIRTSWLYGKYGKGNFVKTMIKLMNERDEIKVVNDQCGNPTYAYDLAEMTLRLILKCDNSKTLVGKNSPLPFGIYHYSNEGNTSWFEFAKEIYRLGKKHKIINRDCNIIPCTTEEFGSSVERPEYSVLDKTKIKKELGVKIPKWQDSLNHFMKQQ